MRSQVDHHLRRARAAARAQTNRERTPVGPVIDELSRTLERIFRDKGIEIDTERLAQVPSLVIGAGLDEVIHPNETRRTADLIGATYEYIPSGSHFGLVMGSRTWPQVAQSVFGWLEERRHAMAAATAVLTSAGAPR